MKEHELKQWPEPFEAVVSGRKRHEVRVNDREYAVGDRLKLREWSPVDSTYSGREVTVDVTYITSAGTFGLPPDLCVMSIRWPRLSQRR